MTATKACRSVQIKDADAGTVEAVISTFNVIDKDGDVVLPGAIKNGTPVRISAFGHQSWQGALPVGKGTVYVERDRAVFKGQFFLDTTAGRDSFLTVRNLAELGEWSYSLHNVKSRRGELNGRPANFLESIDVHEVSPVLQGASVGTRTLVAKSAADGDLDDYLLRSFLWSVGVKHGALTGAPPRPPARI